MELRKLKHYVNRSIELGPRAAFSVIRTRMQNRLFDVYWRSRALQKKAHFRWPDIVKKHNSKKYKNFTVFWAQTSERINFSFQDFKFFFQNNMLIAEADSYVNHIFSIFGSPLKKYERIPWHTDIRLQVESASSKVEFNANAYFKDIKISSGMYQSIKDIKVPWELSRLHHFFILGSAYQLTKNEQYVETFMSHCQDWIDQNSFLLGVNWVCPMDVGIRALNIIWALELFKESPTLSHEFLQKVTETLYNHFHYLENNWEISDLRTSNHYFSDLIGYFYLCYYFYDLPQVSQRAQWCYRALLAECNKQIFDEGADYEGSSSYHELITEIVYHFYILAPKMGFTFDQDFVKKLSNMFSFIDWCMPHSDSSIIRIGDDDSGRILYGLSKALIQSMKSAEYQEIKHFKSFGLSIVKTDQVYYALRHHVYNDKQPSGHFHNDIGSLTLAVDGKPIFVDPGSYLYTPSALWRNRFRSVQNHTTFYVKGSELVEFDDFLFSLQLPEQQFLEEWIDVNNSYRLRTSHSLYKKLYGLTAYRSIEYKQNRNEIVISDCWKSAQKKDPDLLGCWNFTLHPSITVTSVSDVYIFSREEKKIATFKSEIDFKVIDGFVSFQYGTKVATKQLRALVNLMHDDPIETVITLL